MCERLDTAVEREHEVATFTRRSHALDVFDDAAQAVLDDAT